MTPVKIIIFVSTIIILVAFAFYLRAVIMRRKLKKTRLVQPAPFIEIKVKPCCSAELIIAYRIERNADGDEAKINIGYLDLDKVTAWQLLNFISAITDEQLEVRGCRE